MFLSKHRLGIYISVAGTSCITTTERNTTATVNLILVDITRMNPTDTLTTVIKTTDTLTIVILNGEECIGDVDIDIICGLPNACVPFYAKWDILRCPVL